MTYEKKVFDFYGDEIPVHVNEESILIEGKPLVESIGFSWSTQLQKIKSSEFLNVHIDKISKGGCNRGVICFLKSGIHPFFDSFNLKKVGDRLIERFRLYRSDFLNKLSKEIECDRLIDIEDHYVDSREGLRQLIVDSIIRLGNENAIDQLSEVLELALTADIVPDKLPLFERENAPKTREAFKAMLDDIRVKILEISNPVFDIAERTAANHKLIESIKSTSVQSQIEAVANQIYDVDRKSSLILKRIAKGAR